MLTVVGSAGCGRIAFDARSDAAEDAVSVDTITLGPACPSDSRLLACWDFEPTPANQDSTGRGNSLLLTIVNVGPGGVEGKGLFMGPSSRADLSTVNIATVDLSIDAWIEWRAPITTSMAIVFDHNNHWGMALRQDGAIRCGTTGLPTIEGTTLIPEGSWHHIACTYNAATTTGRAYVDGVLEATGTLPTFTADNGAAAVGGNAPATDTPFPWNGVLDRVRIWNVELTAAEVAAAAGR